MEGMADELYTDEVALTHNPKPVAHGRSIGHAPAKHNGNGNLNSSDPFYDIHKRERALMELPFAWAGEKIVGALPESNGEGILGAFYNMAKGQMHHYLVAKKHTRGQELLETPFKGIPILEKIVQNGWSLAYLSQGLTLVDEVYAVVDEYGMEIPIEMKLKGEHKPNLNYLRELGKEMLKLDPEKRYQIAQGIIENKLPKAENTQATKAGVYRELTDGDMEEIIDPSNFKMPYMNAELWLFGKKGKREVISSQNGVNIVRRLRPSPLDVFAFLGMLDGIYTGIDLPFQPFEKGLDSLSRQEIYKGEVLVTIDGGKRIYGKNPLLVPGYSAAVGSSSHH